MQNAAVCFVLHLLLFVNVCSPGTPVKKETILKLIKKLEGLAQNLSYSDLSSTVPTSTENFSASTPAANASVNSTNATNPFLKGHTRFAKFVTLAQPDSSRKYCNEAVCQNVECRIKEVISYGNLRDSKPMPKFHSLLGDKIKSFISLFQFDYAASVYTCCIYNATLMSFNSLDTLSGFQELQKREKNLKGIFWTSGIFSKECNAYVWCPEKEIIPADGGPLKWRVGFPKPGMGECLAVQTGSEKLEANGLFNAHCKNAYSYMCYGAPDVMNS